MIQHSLRYEWADIVWFNFFHELGHILLHGSTKEKAFLDDTFDSDGTFKTDDPDKESEANEFAASSLIPPAHYERLLQRSFRGPQVIKSFAQEVGVHPGVVVGRLHHDDKIHPSLLNDLRDQWDLVAPAKQDC